VNIKQWDRNTTLYNFVPEAYDQSLAVYKLLFVQKMSENKQEKILANIQCRMLTSEALRFVPKGSMMNGGRQEIYTTRTVDGRSKRARGAMAPLNF